MADFDPWITNMNSAEVSGRVAKPQNFDEILRRLDFQASPVFVVLDGAQFDNLPMALLEGDFITQPLYLDRGDNDPERIITSPHMVWLDERTERSTGRTPHETIDAILELIDHNHSAVFWQCPDGGGKLYKHLRSINMIRLPINALPQDDQEYEEGSHSTVLFRHSDANVIAQVVGNLTQVEASRLLGPATRLLCRPNNIWNNGAEYIVVDWSEQWPKPMPGMLTLSDETVIRIENTREAGLKRWAVMDHGSEPHRASQIIQAFDRAQSYGLEEKDDIWSFIRLDKKFGSEFEKRQEYHSVFRALTDEHNSPGARIYYAQQECEKNDWIIKNGK